MLLNVIKRFFAMILNVFSLNRVLDTAALLASVLADLASCEILFALSFRLLPPDNSLVPKWSIIYAVDFFG